MKFKALFLALAVAGAGASFAFAEDNPGGSTTTTGATTTTSTTASDGCRRFELHGTLVSVGASSFTVNATKGNKAVQPAAGTPVTIAFDAKTRVSWSGRGTLTGPNTGDSVHVDGKKCGDALTAAKAQFRGPSGHGEHHGGADSHTDSHQTEPHK